MSTTEATGKAAGLMASWRAGRTVREFAARCGTGLASLNDVALMTGVTHAGPTTVNALGTIDFISEFDYGNAQPIPDGVTPLLPLFSGATRFEATYSYYDMFD